MLEYLTHCRGGGAFRRPDLYCGFRCADHSPRIDKPAVAHQLARIGDVVVVVPHNPVGILQGFRVRNINRVKVALRSAVPYLGINIVAELHHEERARLGNVIGVCRGLYCAGIRWVCEMGRDKLRPGSPIRLLAVYVIAEPEIRHRALRKHERA